MERSRRARGGKQGSKLSLSYSNRAIWPALRSVHATYAQPWGRNRLRRAPAGPKLEDQLRRANPL